MAFTAFQAGDALGRAAVNKALSSLDQSISNLPQTVEPVGTIKQSVKTTLGSNWVLCNGAAITSAQYPELYPLLGSELKDRFLPFSYNIGAGVTGTQVKYINGYWCIFCYTAYQVFLLYSRDGVNWTKQIVFDGGSSTSFAPADIVFGGGKYIIVGTETTNLGFFASILYASAINGNYTLKRVGTQFTSYSKIAYNGLSFMAAGSSGNGGGARIYTEINSSMGVTAHYTVNGDPAVNFVEYLNGAWVVGGGDRIRYATVNYPGGVSNWTLFTPPGDSHSMRYAGGAYYIVTTGGVYRSTGIASGYTVALSGNYRHLAVSDNLIIAAMVTGEIAYRPVSGGSWTTAKLTGASSAGSIQSITASGDTIIAMLNASNNNSVSGYRAYGRVLPAVSPDKSYAYIKARSGT